MTIEEVIYKVYFNYDRARKSKKISIDSPPSEPYSETEVSILIDSIVNKVNSYIASYFLISSSEEEK